MTTTDFISHRYDTMGSHEVTVRAIDNNGEASEKVSLPLDVEFRYTLTVSVSYGWSWGDGSPDTNVKDASHTYTSAGTFTVMLTVTDDQGGTATDTLSSSRPPSRSTSA